MKGDLYTTPDRPYEGTGSEQISSKGKVIDLLLPIITLIICCVIGMLYTGGFFSGAGFVEAFAGSDASVGLVLGSFFALVITLVFYMVRRVMSFNDCRGCIPEGFKLSLIHICLGLEKGHGRRSGGRGGQGTSSGESGDLHRHF